MRVVLGAVAWRIEVCDVTAEQPVLDGEAVARSVAITAATVIAGIGGPCRRPVSVALSFVQADNAKKAKRILRIMSSATGNQQVKDQRLSGGACARSGEPSQKRR